MKTLYAGKFDTIYNYSWDVVENYFNQVEQFSDSGAWIEIEDYIINKIDAVGVDAVADMLMKADALDIHLDYEIAYKDEKLMHYLYSLNNLIEVPDEMTDNLFNPMYDDFYDE